jgi:Siphovirus Gp157
MTNNTESLYSLTDKMLQLLAFVERAENPEELAESIAATEAELQMSIEDKLEGMMTIRQNKLARIEALKNEAKRLTDLAKIEESAVGRIEKYAEDEMTRIGYTYKDKKKSTLAAGKFNLQFKKLPPKLEILDEKKIPMNFMNIPAPPPAAPDKKALLDALKKKAEFLHGKKWTGQIDELPLEEWGVKLVNNNSKFEVK